MRQERGHCVGPKITRVSLAMIAHERHDPARICLDSSRTVPAHRRTVAEHAKQGWSVRHAMTMAPP